MKRIAAFCLTLLLSAPALSAGLPGGWEQIYEWRGVKAYQRSFEGTDVKEYKAVTLLPARLEVVGEVLKDIPGYTEWFPNCKEAREIHDFGNYAKEVYCRMGLPWPVADRDILVKNEVNLDFDTGRAVVDFYAVTDPEVPEIDGVVRMTELTGQYILEYIGRTTTRVTYIHRGHPGGSVPVRLANIAIRYFPYLDLKGLTSQVQEPRYAEAANESQERKMIEDILADRATVRRMMRNRLMVYFQNEKIVDLIMADEANVDRILSDRITFADIKAQVFDTLQQVFTSGKVGQFLEDRELARLIEENPRVVKKLAGDDELVEMILDGNGSFETILKSRVRRWL
ncbi:MAG: hypothetical protein KKA60_08145 [Proteobacteria bacterium]|nr:hypothetical protein [Pseudomonadota bacterium]